MVKRILSASMICLVLLSISAIAFDIQPAKANGESPPPFVLPVNDFVTLIFPPGTVGVTATATETERYPPPPPPPQEEVAIATSDTLPPDGFIGPVWDIQVAGTFSWPVRVRIIFSETEPTPTEILQTDIVLGDVNADGKVNCKDLWIIIKALGSVPGRPRWNQYCDLNGDNKITLRDLCIAFNHLGQTSEWTPLSDIVVVDYPGEHYIEGEANHFSIFGVR